MNEQQAVQTLHAGESWLKQHERLLIVLMVIVAVVWLGNHYLDTRAAAADGSYTAAKAQLTAQVETDKQLTAASQQAVQQYQTLVATLAQQNAQLAASMQNRTVVLTQQQKADTTAPMPDVVTRWQSLAGVCTTCIQPAANGGATVSPDAVRTTVEDLEEVPVLTANLKDAQTEVTNQANLLTKADTSIHDLSLTNTGLLAQVSDEQKACTTQVSALKADAAKSKRNWFIRGLAVGAGVVTAIAIHLAI